MNIYNNSNFRFLLRLALNFKNVPDKFGAGNGSVEHRPRLLSTES